MTDWRDEARCINDPIPWDTPDNNERGAEKYAREAAAKQICNEVCTVTDICLADALKDEGPSNAYNVRGGMTPDERKELLRLRVRQRDLDKKRQKRIEQKEMVAA